MPPCFPKKARPKTFTGYTDAAPKEGSKETAGMRSCLRKSAPGAKESLKWRMPAFSYKRILVAFAAHQHQKS